MKALFSVLIIYLYQSIKIDKNMLRTSIHTKNVRTNRIENESLFYLPDSYSQKRLLQWRIKRDEYAVKLFIDQFHPRPRKVEHVKDKIQEYIFEEFFRTQLKNLNVVGFQEFSSEKKENYYFQSMSNGKKIEIRGFKHKDLLGQVDRIAKVIDKEKYPEYILCRHYQLPFDIKSTAGVMSACTELLGDRKKSILMSMPIDIYKRIMKIDNLPEEELYFNAESINGEELSKKLNRVDDEPNPKLELLDFLSRSDNNILLVHTYTEHYIKTLSEQLFPLYKCAD